MTDEPVYCERCGAETDDPTDHYPLGHDHWAPTLCPDCRDDGADVRGAPRADRR